LEKTIIHFSYIYGSSVKVVGLVYSV
jgi:hypothetical protein